MEMEMWKSVNGYVGHYEISNMGDVRSIKHKPKLLKSYIDTKGYLMVKLCMDGKWKNHRVHHLVADAFLDKQRDGRRMVVDHINEIKTDNRADNLQVITNRENTAKAYRHRITSSKYTGVQKRGDRFIAYININGISKYIGTFIDEQLAAMAYHLQLELHLAKQNELT